MKSKRNIVALLSIMAAVTFGTNQADATTSTDDTLKYGTKPSAQKLLTKGFEKEFARFAQQKSAKLARNTEYQNVMSVVALYNEAPAQFLKLTAEQQNQFRTDVTSLTNQLSRIRGEEVRTWRQMLTNTAHTMNYLWKSAADQPAVDTSEVSVPTVQVW